MVPAISADVAAHVRQSEQLGRTLYILDKVSAIGTDVMLENVKSPSDARIAGWLTIGNADGSGVPPDSYSVLFLTSEEPPRIACGVVVAPDVKPVFERYDPPRAASPGVARLFHARQVALAAMPRNGQPINPVVLPAQQAGVDGILVYLLAGTARAGEMVFGIHYRALISADGAHVVAMTPLSRSALIVRDQDLPPGALPAGAFVTHVVTDWPLETHVFVSLLHHRRPVYVGTKLGQWRVVGDKIELMGTTR